MEGGRGRREKWLGRNDRERGGGRERGLGRHETEGERGGGKDRVEELRREVGRGREGKGVR